MRKRVALFFVTTALSFHAFAQNENKLADICLKALQGYPSTAEGQLLQQACLSAQQKAECVSVQGTPIFHMDKQATRAGARKILVFSLIHGDETDAGVVSRLWAERLMRIDPLNSWRIIPVLNPDGVGKKTRTNANNIDLNRNFPTKDWDELAQKYWKLQNQSSPRRFPGAAAGSEPETKCALAHLAEFKPDFVVSIHTPLNVLDFDGPSRVQAPNYNYLPWKSLGHFPGSLGRYMWFERSIPVLTAELKPSLPKNLDTLNTLQDIVGQLSRFEDKKLVSESNSPSSRN